MVYRRVEFADVEFQTISSTLGVGFYFAAQAVKARVYAPAFHTCVHVPRKVAHPYRLHDQHNRPVHDPVAERQFIDDPFFRLVLDEYVVTGGVIGVIFELLLNLAEVRLQIGGKLLNLGAFPFALAGVVKRRF